MIITTRDGLGMTKVLARRGQTAALARLFQTHFGISLPNAPQRVAAGDVAVLGLGPDIWLATREQGGNDFAVALRPLLAGAASISDQSDAYVGLRLTGSGVRETLAKLIPIDLHPRVFAVGQVAETIAAHIGVLLWRLEDAVDGSPVFDLAVPRSSSVSFCHALSQNN
jgi:heterotetrameric sarcosine oxidase gamma subunit